MIPISAEPERLRVFLQHPAIGCVNPSREALERYRAALTHRSFLHEHGCAGDAGSVTGDYERLEFLGDRVLNLVVAERLFLEGHQSEGEMTARMEFVRNQNLGAIIPSLDIGFPDMILVGRSQDKNARIIASSFEAFIGAFYLDRGLEATRDMIIRLLGDEISSFSPDRNYKKVLQEYVQRFRCSLPVYELVEKTGPDHHPLFTYRVLINGSVYGVGRGENKAAATQNAALDAIQALNYTSRDDPE